MQRESPLGHLSPAALWAALLLALCAVALVAQRMAVA
jgi:hypothetical protein